MTNAIASYYMLEQFEVVGNA